jgi:hypothetical protein
MTLAAVSDPEMYGLVHIHWALSHGKALSKAVERSTALVQGVITAFVPLNQKLTNVQYGGGGSIKECVDRIASVCEAFLSAPGRVVVFEHHLVDAADEIGYLPGPVRVAGGTVYQVAASGFTRGELVRQIVEWNIVPIFNAFLSELGELEVRRLLAAPQKSELDLAPIVSGLRTLICGAYDGEGALVWSAADAGA